MQKYFLRKSIFITLILVGLMLILYTSATAQVSGVVFRDFNGDGVWQTATATYEEPAISGITVNAYNAAGNWLAGTTTNATGNYSFSGLTFPVRIEFTGFPTGFYSSKVGTHNASSVQFYSASTTSANFAVNLPSEYSQPTTDKIVGVQMDNGISSSQQAVYTVPYGNTGSSNAGRANLSSPINPSSGFKVGAVWGLAYQPTTDRVFTSAFMRRFAAFGTNGTGAIYVTTNAKNNPASSASSLFINLNGMTVNNAAGGTTTINTGTDPHDYSDLTKDLNNANGSPFDAVGKISFGDMDISEDKKYLYVVSLNDKKIYRIVIDADNNINTNPSAADVLAYNLPTGGCSNGTARPFGLGIRNNEVYVGVICDAGSKSFSFPNNPQILPTADQTATVYKLSGATFSSVISFPMNYYRGLVSTGDFSGANDHRFKPWISTWTCSFPYPMPNWGRMNYPQPMLSDIIFDVDGSIILGIGDRFAYQVANGIPNPNNDLCVEMRLFDGRGGGDILRVCNTGTLNAPNYVLEGNSGCSRTTSSEVFSYPNSQPVEAEFYVGDNYDEGNSPGHTETTLGALVMSYGSKRVVTTAFNSIDTDNGGGVFRNGFKYLSNANGADLNGYEINSTFGKCSGVGDLEMLGNLAPIEIGNRVFMDTDEDGIQDAGEMGIASVTVKLFNAGVEVASTATDANGQYIFSNVSPNTAYEVRILAANIPSGKQLTLTNTGNGAVGTPEDMRDNDASMISSNAVISYTTGNAGQNDHTLDFGFKTACVISTNISGSTLICSGQSTTLSASGGGTYSWNTGATVAAITVTPTVTTIYNVTVTDGSGCTATASRTVTVNTSSPLIITSSSSCDNHILTTTQSLGSALQFSNSANKVDCGNASSVQITGTTLTLEALVYPTSWRTNYWEGSIIDKEGPGLQGYMLRVGDNGKISFNLGTGSGWEDLITPASTLSLNTWQHIAATYDGTTMRIYVNGTQVTTKSSSVSIANAGSNFIIGNWGGGTDRGFIGMIDEVRVWNTVRTQTDINANKFVNIASNTSGLKAYYKLDEGSGSSTTDATGLGNSGTLSGSPAPTWASLTGTPLTYLWSNGATTASITATTSGTYTVTVTNASGCTAVASTTVTVNSSSTAGSFNTSACPGSSINLNATSSLVPNGNFQSITGFSTEVSGANTYFGSTTNPNAVLSGWPTIGDHTTGSSNMAYFSDDNTPISNRRQLYVSQAVTAGKTYTLSVWARNLYTGSPSLYWTVNGTQVGSSLTPISSAWTKLTTTWTASSTATVTFAIVLAQNHSDYDFVLDDFSIQENLAHTFAWSGPNSFSSTSQNPTISNATVAMAGTYTVTATNISNGCTATATANVTVNALPTASITGTNTICNGSSTTLTASGGGTYSWNTGVTVAAITVSPTVSTTYSVTVTNVSNGCTATATANVTVNASPTASITGTNIICNGSSTTLTASGGGTYSWNTGAMVAVITVSPTVTTTYSVTVTNANGCIAVASRTVTVNALPTATATGSTVCVGGNLAATATGGDAYSWSGPGGFSTSAASFMRFNATTAMNGLYFVTVTNSASCTVVATISLAVITSPTVPTLTNSGPVCSGQTINLAVSGLAPSNQAISLNGTNQYVNVVHDIPENNFTIETWVKTSATNGGIFSATASGAHDRHIGFTNGYLFFRVWNSPTWNTGISINDNQWHHIALVVETGVGQRAYVDGVPVIVTNAYDHSDFNWQTDFTIGYSNDGGYLNGQMDNTRIWNIARTAQQIMDNMRLNMPTSTTGLIANYLYNGNINATTGVNGTAPNGISYISPSEYTYNWTGTNAPSSGTAETVSTTGAASGSYAVSYTKNTCVSGSISTTPTINPLPTASITGTNTICNGSSTTLTASGGGTYLWNTGAMVAAITVSPTVTTTYSVTVTNASGCIAIASRTVTVNASSTASITGTNIICNGSSTTLTASGGGTYSWNTGATVAAITVSPTVTTTYSVTVTNANGCIAVATQTVTVTTAPSAGTGSSITVCKTEYGINNTILSSLITGASSGAGTWSVVSYPIGLSLANVSGKLSAGIWNRTGFPKGTYVFRYTITGTPPCPNDTEDVTIIINTCCQAQFCVPMLSKKN